MDEEKIAAIDAGVAAMALRVEAMDRMLQIIAAAVITQYDDPLGVLDALAREQPPAHGAINGVRIDATPEHQKAWTDAFQMLVERVRARVHRAALPDR